jgi:hypothetical protein
MMKTRILVISNAYPHAAHGYVNNDVEYLASRAEVLVLSKRQPTAPFFSPVTFNYFDDYAQLELQAREFKPDFVVSWLLPNHFYARRVSESLDIPFVLKVHTPDLFRLYKGWSRPLDRLKALLQGEERFSRSYRISMPSLGETARSRNLKGIFCIPAYRGVIEEYFDKRLVIDMQPRFPYRRFLNTQDNGDGLFALGSLVNRRENHVTFSETLSVINAPVDWYPMPTPGCLWMNVPDIPANIRIRHYVPPAEMPALYKQYKAMLAIGHGKIGRGLPMSVLEAQAAGVAVIAPSLRPDFDRFVLNGGGYIFKDESEIPSILKQVPDQARREMGFAHAAQYAMEGLEQELAAAGLKLQ